MDFDKKDWEKKLKNFFLDNQYKTEDENLRMIFKTKRKHSDYIRIFYKNQRYLYFRYRKSLKRSKNEYALSTEISFEADLHYEVAKLSILNLPRVEVSFKKIADALENENFEQILWRIYFSEIFGAKVVNVEIEKLKNNLNVLLVSKEQEKKELDFFQDFKSLGGIENNFQDFKNKHYEEIKELEKENFNDYILKAKEITPWAFMNNEFETKNKVEEIKEIKKSNLVKGTLYKKTNI